MDGNNTRLLRIAESTWGTTPAVTPGDMVVIPVSDCGFEFEQAPQSGRRNRAGTWNPPRPAKGRSRCEGPLAFFLNGLAHGFVLCDWFGAPATSGPVGGVYTHVWKLGAPPVGATYQPGSPSDGLFNAFTGMRNTGFKVKAADVGGIECSATYAGEQDLPGTTALDTAPTEYADNTFELCVPKGAGSLVVEMGGADVGDLLDLEFEVQRPRGDPKFALGSQGIPANMPLRRGEIPGKVSFKYADWARYNLARAGTPTSFKVGVGVGDGSGTLGNEYAEMLLPEVLLAAKSPNLFSDGDVVEEHAFFAYYAAAAEQTAVQFTLKNTIAVYA